MIATCLARVHNGLAAPEAGREAEQEAEQEAGQEANPSGGDGGDGGGHGNGDDGPSPFVYLCLLGLLIFCFCRGDAEGNNQRNIEEGVPPVARVTRVTDEEDDRRRKQLEKRLDEVRSHMDEKDMP